MKDSIREKLAFQDLTQEEKEKRHILGRLYGPVADVVYPTRNGRRYSEELWENVFKNPLMQEKFKNKVMYGELGHPEDREQVDLDKVAICMPEPPKKDENGKLIAYFDILDTPNGRILKTLCDYGSTLGVSSRGTGDIVGDEVNPDTYDCECWDIVIIPAVESARLQFTEGLEKKKSLKQALVENLNSATEEERKIMTETLEDLNIDIKEEPKETSIPEEIKGEDIKVDEESSETSKQAEEKSEEANDDGTNEIIKSLQEALLARSTLERKIIELQEKLAVSDSKVSEQEATISQLQALTARLGIKAHEAKTLTSKVSKLEEQLKEKDETINNQLSEIHHLNETLLLSKKAETTSLNESLDNSKKEVKALKEQLSSQKTSYETRISELTESLRQTKEISEAKAKEITEQLTKMTTSRNGYKKLAITTVNKYIESKANMLGVTAVEIKNRLPESYTIDDIDTICEDLQESVLGLSKLPIQLGKTSRIQFVESKTDRFASTKDFTDDDVDESLVKLAKLKV